MNTAAVSVQNQVHGRLADLSHGPRRPAGETAARPAPPIHLHLHLTTISSRTLTSMIDGVTAPAGERAAATAAGEPQRYSVVHHPTSEEDWLRLTAAVWSTRLVITFQ